MRTKILPPALKHGVYSATALLPGENPAEFEQLHKELIAECTPAGVLEDEIVADLSRFLWRKKRLATLRIAKLARDRHSEIMQELTEQARAAEHRALVATPEDSDVSDTTAEETTDDAHYTYYGRKRIRQAADRQSKQELGDHYELIEVGDPATIHHLNDELDVEERLNTMIDRCLKRLLSVRAFKSLAPASQSKPSIALFPPSSEIQ